MKTKILNRCAVGVALGGALLMQVATVTTHAQPLVNLGLVGVGRVPADTLDIIGLDSLGGMFSALWLDPATVSQTGAAYSATLYPLPDRGFGDGAAAYHPRLQRASFSITPYYGSGPVAQDQIVFANNGTLIFTENGNRFTGYIPDDTNFVAYPQSLPGGLGLGLRCLDPEGVTRAADGTWYIADEYGPFIYHFDASGTLLNTLTPPDAYLPKMGPTYPRVINYNAASTVATNDSGRYNNRGLEGVTITPSGKKLVAVLQSPLVQDGQNRNPSRNARILVYDLDSASPTYHLPVGEYIHVLPLNATEANNQHTPISEVLALSETKFLILQRDGRGLGGTAGAFLYKRIVEVDISAASNIIGTGYDLEKGAPGQLSLPRATLPAGIVAVTSRDLVDIINPAQLAKYGLNLIGVSSNQNANTVCEKWEGMAVLPLNDPAAPNDYLLLVGNDNDFKTSVVYHNGVAVGSNTVIVDNMLLAFRIGADSTVPTLTCPSEVTVAASTNCTLPSLASVVTATDNSAAPIAISQSPAIGSPVVLGVPLAVTVSATDAAGNAATPCVIMVTVTDQTAPTLVVPANQVVNVEAGVSSAVANFTATATENCSPNPVVNCTPPSGSTFPVGTTTVTCTATDVAGNVATKSFTVLVNNCPVAGIVVTPQFVAPGLTTSTVLSLDNQTGCAVLDGSQSADANGNALTFRWRADGAAAVIATGARATNCFSLGTHTVTLAVNDSSCTNQASVSLEVITVGEATELLISEVNATSLNIRVQRSLAASLKSAQASFDRGQVEAGLAQLVAYQNKVRVLVPVNNASLSAQLIRSAQNLIDTIRAAQAL